MMNLNLKKLKKKVKGNRVFKILKNLLQKKIKIKKIEAWWSQKILKCP